MIWLINKLCLFSYQYFTDLLHDFLWSIPKENTYWSDWYWYILFHSKFIIFNLIFLKRRPEQRLPFFFCDANYRPFFEDLPLGSHFFVTWLLKSAGIHSLFLDNQSCFKCSQLSDHFMCSCFAPRGSYEGSLNNFPWWDASRLFKILDLVSKKLLNGINNLVYYNLVSCRNLNTKTWKKSLSLLVLIFLGIFTEFW